MSPKADTIEFSRNTGFLFKGPPGFGKTLAATSAAIFGPVWLAYLDKQAPVEVLAWYRKHRPALLQDIEYDSYGSHNVHQYLNKLIEFSKTGCPYVAIITDGVTSLTSAAVNWSMGFRDPNSSKTDKKNKDAPQLIPDWDEYKVETSLVTQALDICKTLPVMNIWTAHPLATVKVEGSGTVDRVTKGSSLVSYGAKVGSLIPGGFQEIYHFGSQGEQRRVYTSSAGEDYAKTVFNIPKYLDIQDRLFFEVWRDAVNKGMEEGAVDEIKNPFDPGSGGNKWRV